MKIGVDISMLVYRGSGVARYTYELVSNLLHFDTQNEYHLFYSSFRRPSDFTYLTDLAGAGGILHDYPFPPRVLKFCWNRIQILPIELFTGKMDYFFTSDYLRPPLFRSTRGITTIHDLTWKIYPEFHTPEIVSAHERKIFRSIKGKDMIICDSYNTKNDLLKYYPEVQVMNQLKIIYPGVNLAFKRIPDRMVIASVLKKYHLEYPCDYLLYVGAIEPRKNLEKCVEIYATLIKEPAYADYRFVIVGRAGWKNDNVFRMINRLGLAEKITFVGFVEDGDLAYFYNASRALFYLSKYEGFGLPPMEAAKCGTPSLLYNNSSLKELFNPEYPYAGIGSELQTLKTLLNQPEVVKLAKHFDWQDACLQFTQALSNHDN